MRQIQLADQLYDEVQRRATEEGFDSVDEFVAKIVSESIQDQSENFDHLFTPERIAHLDRICAEIDAGGKTYAPEEVEEYLEKKRAQWLKDHAS